MNRNWLRSSITMLMIAAPIGAIAQEPPVANPINSPVVPGNIFIPATVIAPAVDPTVETFALASGDVLTWRSAEATSPSDSLNSPIQAAPATWTTQAAPDGFEERIARLEAQVAALSQQLRSGGALAGPSHPAAYRTINVTPTTRAVQVAPAIAAPPVAVNVRTSRNPATTATVAPGAPIVIHVYVHPDPASAAAAPSVFRYQVAPAIAPPAVATPAPTRVRARVEVPATGADPAATPRAYSVPLNSGVPGIPGVPATPATPATPAAPATPAPPGVQFIPAIPAPPNAPAALPALPTPPIAPSATTESPALAPASRLAWDDLPGEK